MKTQTVVLGGLAVAAIYGVAKLGALDNAGDRLNVDLDKVYWKGFSAGNLLLDVKALATNPTGTNLPIQEVDLSFSLPGTGTLARLAATQAQLGPSAGLVKANATTSLTFPMRVSLLSLFLTVGTTIANQLKNGQLPSQVAVTGFVRVAGIKIPYSKSIPLTR